MRTKKWLLTLLFTSLSFSQNKQLLFGLNETPQSLLVNPGGKIENKWYFGIPFLSHFHANVGFSGVTANDLFEDNNVPFGEKLAQVISNLDANDFFGANQQMELLSVGFTLGEIGNQNKYLSFGIYQETDVIAYFPKDVATLFSDGNASHIGRYFNLNQIKASAESLMVFHIGLTKKQSKQLNYGIRGKLYFSFLNVSSIHNKGTFSTVTGNNNFYDHNFNLDLEMRTSGVKGLESNGGIGQFLKGGNLGLGIDLGMHYVLNQQSTFDLSIQDIGFISHSKNIENYIYNGQYTFSGINPLFPSGQGSQTAQEYWDEIENNFNDLFTLKKTDQSYVTFRPIKLNSALRYAFGESYNEICDCINKEEGYVNEIGIQLYSISRPRKIQNALTLYYNRKLFNALRLKGTYTIDSYSFKNMGLGLTSQLGKVNFYLFADNLLDYQNLAKAKSVSLQLGFNYIFGKK